jgi:hypothetical protein
MDAKQDPKQQPPRYHAYMLRMWEERSEDLGNGAHWRFQMEDPHTGRRHGFNDLSDLLAYLQDVVAYEEDAGLGPALEDR